MGAAVRAVHRGRRRQPARHVARGALGRGPGRRHRRQPADLRSLPAPHGGARPGQPGRGRAADLGRQGPRARRAGGPLGLSARRRGLRRSAPRSSARTSRQGPASELAVRQALEAAGVALADIAAFDLYSCFPIAVFNICDALGLGPDDPRGLTVTGGLPFFGGAGNNYSMHAIASMARKLRRHARHARPGRRQRRLPDRNTRSGSIRPPRPTGAGSTAPAAGRDRRLARARRWPATPARRPSRPTRSRTRRDGAGPASSSAADRDGRRFVAQGDDAGLEGLLGTAEESIGQAVYVQSFGIGNRVTTGEGADGRAVPAGPPVLREATSTCWCVATATCSRSPSTGRRPATACTRWRTTNSTTF